MRTAVPRCLPLLLAAPRCLALLLAALVLAPTAARAGVDWEHPWLPDHLLDFGHPAWGRFDPISFFGYVTEEATTTVEHLPDGSLRFVWDARIAIADPSQLPAFLELDSLSAARNSKVVAFQASFKPERGPRQILDRRRLVERAASQHAMYFDGDTVLSLLPPREQPGWLTVHLETLSEPHVGFEEYFGGVQFVQIGSACERRIIRLRAPADERLSIETRFFEGRPRRRVKDGVQELEFVFGNLLPSLVDDDMPPSMDAFPAILYSNQPTWEALATIVKDAWDPHLSPDPELTAFAEELVADLPDDDRLRARAIHDAVGDGWGYLGFYPGESGWIPHSAKACWSARLGDCKDRSALMIVLMRAVGIEAAPVILWSGRSFATPKVPILVANHAIVQVMADGEALYLDSVDTGIGALRLRETLADRAALVMGADPGLYMIPPTDPEASLEEDEAYVSVQPDGSAEIFLTRHWYGEDASARRSMWTGPDRVLWEQALREQLAVTYPRARIAEIVQKPHADDDQVWRMEVTLRSETFLQRRGDYGVFTPPWILRWRSEGAAQDRRHPRRVDPSWSRSVIRVFLPRGFSLVAAPTAEVTSVSRMLKGKLEVENRSGEVALTLDVRSKGGTLSIDSEEDRSRFFADLGAFQDQSVVVRFPEPEPAE